MATLAPPHTSVTTPRPPSRPLYPRAQYYFFAAMAITWLGFSRTYFNVVRTEPLIHHIHGMLMGGWIALLILQPILYQRGKLRLHRTLGRWGVYLLVPAIILCGLLMDRRMLQLHNAPPLVIDQLAFLDLGSLILFATLIFLSTWYARNLQLHARYIVCTVVLLMPPALARALFFVPGLHSFHTNVNLGCALAVAALVVLIFDDRRRGRIWLPYPLTAIVLAVLTLLSNYARTWFWWQTLATHLGA